MCGPFFQPDNSNKWSVRKWDQQENLYTDWLLGDTKEYIF